MLCKLLNLESWVFYTKPHYLSVLFRLQIICFQNIEYNMRTSKKASKWEGIWKYTDACLPSLLHPFRIGDITAWVIDLHAWVMMIVTKAYSKLWCRSSSILTLLMINQSYFLTMKVFLAWNNFGSKFC